MGVKIAGNSSTGEGEACLYDSTTGIAFGPVFQDYDEADEFLAWHDRKVESGDAAFGDLREYKPQDLMVWRKLFLAEQESADLERMTREG